MNTVVEILNIAGRAFVEFMLPMLIQSGVLILILLAVDVILRRKVRAVFRYWIWMLVLVKLVLPPSLGSPVSFGTWFGDTLEVPAASLLEPEPPQAAEPRATELSPVVSSLLSPPDPMIAPPLMLSPAVVESPEADVAPAQPPEPRLSVQVPAVSLSWQGLVLLVWSAVVLALTLLLIQRAYFVRGLVAQSDEASGPMLDELEACRRRLGLRAQIDLRLSPNATSPAVCGLLRPTVLIPQTLAPRLHAHALHAVLLHELAHVKRGDLWINLLQTLFQIVHFYNPLLWLANAMIRRTREQAVDEAVLVAMGEAAPQYPETLVSIAKLAFARRPALSLRLIGVVESKSALTGRIKHIVARPLPKTAKLGGIGLLTLLVLAAVLLPMAKARQSDDEAMSRLAVLPNCGVWLSDISGQDLPVLDFASEKIIVLPAVQKEHDLLRMTDPQGQGDVLYYYDSEKGRPKITFMGSAGLGGEPVSDEYEMVTITPMQMPFETTLTTWDGTRFKIRIVRADEEACSIRFRPLQGDRERFKAILPDNMTVELVGICEYPSEGRQWWGPDGQPLEEVPCVRHPGDRLGSLCSDDRGYEIAFRFARTDGLDFDWQAEGAPGWMVNHPHDPNMGAMLQDMKLFMAKFPATQRTTRIKIDITRKSDGASKVQWLPSIQFEGISLQPSQKTSVEINAEIRDAKPRPPQPADSAVEDGSQDSDGDGLSDCEEIHKYLTDPTKADSDGDGTPDGDWNERREYAYSVRTVLLYMPPFDEDGLNDDFQDGRVLARTEEYVEVEVIHYPLATGYDSVSENRNWRQDYAGMTEFLAPGATTNWDDAMRRDLLAALKADGIDIETLSDRQVVEQVSSWLMKRSRSLDKVFTTYYVHYPQGKPEVLPGLEDAFRREFERDSGSYDWTLAEHFDHELLGKGMFYNRTHGSCTSTAVYLTTVLRAVGIPTRMVLATPAVDASDREQISMVKKTLTHNRVRETVLAGLRRSNHGFTNHTFNEVYVGGRWQRLDFTRLGCPAFGVDRFGLQTHLYTINDLSDVDFAATWGRRYARGERTDLFKHSNPYSAVEVSELFGVHANIPNPPFAPPDVSSSGKSDVFLFSPSKAHVWDDFLAKVEGRTWNKTGRPHVKEHYDNLFEGVWPSKPGDIVVLLFSLDTPERIPEGYEDLLPKPWSEIESELAQGKTVELAGKAREMNVVLLAAPTADSLKPLVQNSELLGGPVRPEAALADGAKVELLGICEYPSEGRQWWRPDGSLMDSAPYKTTKNNREQEAGFKDYELAVRYGGGDISIEWDVPGCRDSGRTGNPFGEDDRRIYDLTVNTVRFPDSQTAATVRVAAAAGPWETRAVHKTLDREGAYSLNGGKGAAFGIAHAQEGDTLVSVTVNFSRRDMAFRVVAVRGQGEILQGGLSGYGGRELDSRTYRFNCPLSDVREFRFETRPWTWFEFKDVSLRPGQKAVSTEQPRREAKVLGIGPAWEALRDTLGSRYGGSIGGFGRDEERSTEDLDKVLSWTRPGNVFVLMLALDKSPVVPAQYRDLLPLPWSEIESRVRKGESVEASGKARGLDVIVLATATSEQLETLVRQTRLLDAFRPGTSKEIVLPDADREAAMLDLATGKISPLPKAESPDDFWRAISELGQGDLVYDSNALVLVRGAASDQARTGPVAPFKTYSFGPPLPKTLTVTTAEGRGYEVTILAVDEKGCALKYSPISTDRGAGGGVPVESRGGRPEQQEGGTGIAETSNQGEENLTDTSGQPMAEENMRRAWEQRRLAGENMRQLSLALAMYANQHEGTLPTTLSLLAPYLSDPAVLTWLSENVTYAGEGTIHVRRAHSIVVAYEKAPQSTGERYVLFLDYHIELARSQRLKELDLENTSQSLEEEKSRPEKPEPPREHSRITLERLMAQRRALLTEYSDTGSSDATTGGALEFRIAPKGSVLDSADLERYQRALANGDNPPGADFAWFPIRAGTNTSPEVVIQEREGTTYALLWNKPPHAILASQDWGLDSVYRSQDASRRPAVGLTFNEKGASFFHDITAAHVDQALAILVEGKVLSMPRIQAPLGKAAIITGTFSEQDIQGLIAALQGEKRVAEGREMIGNSPAKPSGQPDGMLKRLIDGAPAGGVVTVPKGRYTTPIEVTKPLVFRGESPEGCVIEVTADRPAVLVNTGGQGEVTIENLTIQWQLATQDRVEQSFALLVKDTNAVVRNCRFVPLGEPRVSPVAVQVEGRSKTTVENCRFRGFEYVICYGQGTEGVVQDCVIADCGHQGVIAYDGATLTVQRNIITGSKFHAVRCTGGTLTVKDNLLIENANRGIYLGNRTGRGTITNNAIFGNGSGISGFGRADYIIANNVIVNCRHAGIDMRDSCLLSIRDNVLAKNQRGIVLFKEGAENSNVIAENAYWENGTDFENLEKPEKSLLADPQFADPNHGDFTVRGPVRDQGHGLTDPSIIRGLWEKYRQLPQSERVESTPQRGAGEGVNTQPSREAPKSESAPAEATAAAEAPGPIQRRINEAAPGAMIRLEPGVYKERLTIDKPLTLEGAGWDKTSIVVQIQAAELFQQVQQAAKSSPGELEQLRKRYTEEVARPVLAITNVRGVTVRGIKFSLPGRGSRAGHSRRPSSRSAMVTLASRIVRLSPGRGTAFASSTNPMQRSSAAWWRRSGARASAWGRARTYRSCGSRTATFATATTPGFALPRRARPPSSGAGSRALPGMGFDTTTLRP